jgi:divalent metal cation (Fe/Co/Zn/Cd) transporter
LVSPPHRRNLGRNQSAVPPRYATYLSLALLAGVGLHELFGWWWADPVGALAMLPVILWQGREPLRHSLSAML